MRKETVGLLVAVVFGAIMIAFESMVVAQEPSAKEPAAAQEPSPNQPEAAQETAPKEPVGAQEPSSKEPAAGQEPSTKEPEAAQETAPKEPEAENQSLLDTSGRFSVFFQGGFGIGFDSVDVGETSDGDKVTISGGGGIGAGVGVGYGISRCFDLDLNFGVQESGLSPALSNAEGSFTRSYLMGTIKRKFATSDRGQVKVGVGAGMYSGGKLDLDTTDAGGSRMVIRYDDASGFHVTGEFEQFFSKNTSIQIGGKLYFVKYKANSWNVNGVSFPVNSLRSDVKELNGSGIDFVAGIRQYF